MVKKIIFIMVCVLLVQTIVATDTEIHIKTLPYHEVQVAVMSSSSEGSTVLERFKDNSDLYGDLSFVYVDGVPIFNLNVFVKSNGEMVVKELFEGYRAGESISVELAPEGTTLTETPGTEEVVENETEEVDEALLEEEVPEEIVEEEELVAESAGITGDVVSGEDAVSLPNNFFYYVGGFFVLLFLIVLTVGLTRYSMMKKGPGKDIKIKKMSELKEEKREKIDDYREIVEDAEKKINEAQEEIKKLKESGNLKQREDKIEAAKKKIMEDEKELIRLRQDLKETRDS